MTSSLIRKSSSNDTDTLVLPQHVIHETTFCWGGFTSYPTTPGQIILQHPYGRPLMSSTLSDFAAIMRDCQLVARTLKDTTDVKRCAFACDGSSVFSITPLHGLSEAWEPVVHHEEVPYHEVFPGYLTTKNRPVISDDELDSVQETITAVTGLKSPLNFEFDGDDSDQNLFSNIVRGQTSQWRIWENKTHVAFLTPFGNTRGFTVLVPRRHLTSDIFALHFEEYRDLTTAAYEVAQNLKKAFNIDRCGIFFECYEIDYAHAKLVPVHQEDMPREGLYNRLLDRTDFHESYKGFLTTQLGPPAKDTGLLDKLVAEYQRNWFVT